MFKKIIIFLFSMFFSIEDSIDYKIHSIDRNSIILYEEEPEVIMHSNNSNFLSDSEAILIQYHDRILKRNYGKELIIALKTGEILKISNPQNISEGIYEVNILKQNLNSNFLYNNSKIKKIQNQSLQPKRIKEININEIVYIDVIDYKKEFKIMRDYSLITISFFFIINAFFN